MQAREGKKTKPGKKKRARLLARKTAQRAEQAAAEAAEAAGPGHEVRQNASISLRPGVAVL